MEDIRDISLKQSDFENSAIIFDLIRDFYKKSQPNKDELLAEQFDEHIKFIINK